MWSHGQRGCLCACLVEVCSWHKQENHIHPFCQSAHHSLSLFFLSEHKEPPQAGAGSTQPTITLQPAANKPSHPTRLSSSSFFLLFLSSSFLVFAPEVYHFGLSQLVLIYQVGCCRSLRSLTCIFMPLAPHKGPWALLGSLKFQHTTHLLPAEI